MKKYFKIVFIIFCFNCSIVFGQCINTTQYGTAIINSCSTGTITTCNWALEYSDLTFNTVGTYTFNSSISTDYLTLTTSANVVIASGNAPLVASIPSIGGYRLHVSTNSACGTDNTCRITTYACGTATTSTVGCINPTAYGSATITSCSNGTITTCNYAGEYSELAFGTTGTFTFNSSTGTDYLTFTDDLNNVLFYGNTPLTVTVSSLGNYRLHVSSNSACGTDATCRVTAYACGTATTSTVGCISPTAFGTATITSCSAGTITTCNYAGEYSELALGTTGAFTFYSTTTTDYLTFTDNLNNILFYGNTPLAVNISTLGNYRLHVSSNSACGTDATCRTTSYNCINTPCSGTPNAGTTTVSSGTICGAQNIGFGLSGSTIALNLMYQWQSSPNNTTWTSIPSFTNSTMTQLVNASTYYRCIVACGTFTASSVSGFISLGGTPLGGTAIASSTNSCAGSSINFSLSGSSAWAGLNYQWQSSLNNITWSNLAGFIAPTMTQLVNTSMYYRCILSCSSSTAASTSVFVASASPLSYASIPYYETFDNVWQNGCATSNVPNNSNWKSNPLSGDNAWRKQSDGASAGWTSATSGTVSPHSGNGCADFHSTQNAANIKGDLDVLVNLNQNAKYAISFYYINQTGNDDLTVLLSTDAGISFSIKGSYNTQAAWAKKTIYYNAVNTPSCIVKFKGNSDNGNDDLGIDSLSIRLVCLNPTISVITSTATVCLGQSATLTASGATNYTWTPSGITTSSAVVSPTINTNYVVTGSNDGLCFPTSVISISVTTCAISVIELTDDNAAIYPNPTNGVLNIEFKTEYNNSGFELFNVIGELVIKKELNDKNTRLTTEHVPTGVYFYKITRNGSTIKTGKLVKE